MNEQAEPGHGAEISIQRRTILVVDDDQEASLAIARLLEYLGHTPVRCDNAPEALAQIQRGSFDLVLIDYRMPEITGLDLVSMLREQSCPLPAIMMTGFSASEDRIPSGELGISAVLRKPISADQLARAIEDSLQKQRSTP